MTVAPQSEPLNSVPKARGTPVSTVSDDGDTAIGTQTSSAQQSAANQSTAPFSRLAAWAIFGVVLTLLVLMMSGWWLSQRIRNSETVVAERMLKLESDNEALRGQLKLANDLQRDTAARQSLSEARLSESLAQQSQLERRYEELAKVRGEIQLSDVETTLSAAIQQLQVSGNVRNALLALQDADARLAAMNQPPLLGVRRSLARDIEALKQHEVADPWSLANKVEVIAENSVRFRLLSEPANRISEKPATPPNYVAKGVEPKTSKASESEKKSVAVADTETNLIDRLGRASQQGWSALKAELLQVVRVQKVEQPDSLLLAPEQAWFVRENLKLRLTALRLGLLTRNEVGVKADSRVALQALKMYFDSKDPAVAQAIVDLEPLQTSKLNVELPSFAETLGKLRALRGKQN